MAKKKKAKKKPEGWDKFDALTRKLLRVPKAAVDRRIEEEKQEKKKKE